MSVVLEMSLSQGMMYLTICTYTHMNLFLALTITYTISLIVTFNYLDQVRYMLIDIARSALS